MAKTPPSRSYRLLSGVVCRKTMIVALARRLLIALWRLVRQGVVPEVSLCARPDRREPAFRFTDRLTVSARSALR